MKQTEQTLIDTSELSTYEEYVEECNECGKEPEKDGSEHYWDFVNRRKKDDWEYFYDVMKKWDKNIGRCVCMGSGGYWFGRCEIVPTIASLTELLDKTMSIRGDYYYQVKLIGNKAGGHLDVRVSHHDGTDKYKIFRLSKRGENKYENALENYYGLNEDKFKFNPNTDILKRSFKIEDYVL